MNYPFKKKKSLCRLLSLSLVLLLTMAMLSGCSLLPGGNNTEPSAEDTQPSSDIPNVVTTEPTSAPTTAPTTVPTTAPKKDNVAIVKEQINMRVSPGTSARVVTAVDAGEELEVMRLDPIGSVTWAFVHYTAMNLSGWVTTDMLDMSNVTISSDDTSTPGSTNPTTSTTPTTATNPTTPTTNPTTPTVDNITGTGTPAGSKKAVVTASELNIRRTASQSADRVGSYTYGDRITILESSNGWGRTDKGWVSLSYVYVDGDVGTNSVYGTVTATQLNVRSGPGTTYDKVKSLNQNDRVQIMQQIKVGGTNWGYTSGGWVSMDYISVDGSTGGTTGGTTGGNNGTTSGRTGVITGNTVNIRAGAGTNYDTVGSKSSGDTVTILETVASNDGRIWGRIDLGWICMDYVRLN